MARLNARQKRAAKAHKATLEKALLSNASTVAQSGDMRSSTTGHKAVILNETYYGFAKGLSQAAMKHKPATKEGSPIGAHEGKAGKIVDGKVKAPSAPRHAVGITRFMPDLGGGTIAPMSPVKATPTLEERRKANRQREASKMAQQKRWDMKVD
jgi:hypothetical protein